MPRQTSWSDRAGLGPCGVGTRFRSVGGFCHTARSTQLFLSETITAGRDIWPGSDGSVMEAKNGRLKWGKRHREKGIKGTVCFARPIRTSQVRHALNGHWCWVTLCVLYPIRGNNLWPCWCSRSLPDRIRFILCDIIILSAKMINRSCKSVMTKCPLVGFFFPGITIQEQGYAQTASLFVPPSSTLPQ